MDCINNGACRYMHASALHLCLLAEYDDGRGSLPETDELPKLDGGDVEKERRMKKRSRRYGSASRTHWLLLVVGVVGDERGAGTTLHGRTRPRRSFIGLLGKKGSMLGELKME
jgi:hypothetical protein